MTAAAADNYFADLCAIQIQPPGGSFITVAMGQDLELTFKSTETYARGMGSELIQNRAKYGIQVDVKLSWLKFLPAVSSWAPFYITNPTAGDGTLLDTCRCALFNVTGEIYPMTTGNDNWLRTVTGSARRRSSGRSTKPRSWSRSKSRRLSSRWSRAPAPLAHPSISPVPGRGCGSTPATTSSSRRCVISTKKRSTGAGRRLSRLRRPRRRRSTGRRCRSQRKMSPSAPTARPATMSFPSCSRGPGWSSTARSSKPVT